MNIFLVSAAAWNLLSPQSSLSLDEAIRIASENSFALKIAASNVSKTRERINETRAQAGPQINARATYTRFDKATISDFGNGPTVISPIDQKQAQLTLSWPIDLFGTIGRTISAARAGEQAGLFTYEAAKNDVKLNVKNAFFTVLQAKNSVEVQKEALSRAELQLTNARLEFEKGSKAKVDVLRFETQVSQAKADLIAAENSLSLSKSTFNNVLGRPIETPFDLEEVKPIQAPEWTESALVDAAMKNRPELKSSEFQIKALESVKRVEEGGMSPSLSLSANHTRNIDAIGFNARSSSTTGVLAVSLPLFDSGLTRARVAQAREDVLQAKVQLDQLKLGVSLEVRQAISNLLNAQARLSVAETQVKVAQESFDIATLRDRVGEGIALQVVDAQTELTRAKTGLINAKFDFRKAFAALQRATGADDLQPRQGEDTK